MQSLLKLHFRFIHLHHTQWKASSKYKDIRKDVEGICISLIEVLSFPVAQYPNLGLGHLLLEVSRSHTIRHTYSR
jgi:hypothetical protein